MLKSNLSKILIIMVAVATTFSASKTEEALALAGAINNTVQNMQSGGSSSSSSSCSSCSQSSGGSLISQINTSVQTSQSSSSSSSSSTSSTSSTSSSSAPSCPFTPGTNRYVVQLGQSIRADNTQDRSRQLVNTDLPAGRYNIRVMTWDSRTHGDQGQNREQVVLQLLGSGGSVLHTTNRSQDIPANSTSIISTLSTNANVSGTVRQVLAYHPEYPSSNPQSLVPICAEFQRIQEPVQENFNIQCNISRSTIDAGDRVNIDVDIRGGRSPYYIDWYGDTRLIDGFNLTRQSQLIRINEPGTYRLRVEVEDRNGNWDSDTCTIRVREDSTTNINVISSTTPTPPSGDLAGLSSVYLSQVPYTGPEDTLKVLGFIALTLIWSSTIAYYFMKDRKKKQISNRISAFKEANKVRVTNK